MRLNIFNVPQKKENHTGFERHEFSLFLKLQFTQTFSPNVLKKSSQKDNILKMLVTKQLMALFSILWKSMATVNCLVTIILKSIFFCVQQKKEIHNGLEQHEDE